MTEVAGVVLGAIPIVIWAIDKYREPVRTFFKYETILESFKIDLMLQQEQLHATLSVIGIKIPPSADELEERLGRMSPSQNTLFTVIIGEMNSVIEGLLEKLKVDTRGKPKWTTEPPDRAKWEWTRIKRSLGSKDRKEAIERLQRWNTALKHCFERQEIPFEESTSPSIAAMQKKFSVDHCNATRNHAAAIYRVLERHWNCGCRIAHQATMDLLWHQNDASQSNQRFHITLSYPPQGTIPGSSSCRVRWHKVKTWVDEEESQSAEANDSLSNQTPRQKGRVTFAVAPQARPGPLQPKSASLNTSKSAVTNASKSTPQKVTKDKTVIGDLCLAFQHSKLSDPYEETLVEHGDSVKRNIHLSITRNAIAASLELTSVRSLLESQTFSRQFELSLGQRLCMAAAMTWGVLHLGDSPWLTNMWQQEGLQFFLENSAQSTTFPDATPCISSMLNEKGQPMHDQHSCTLKNLLQYGNIRNQTLFTLGVYLIELGLDKPFETLRKEHAAIQGGGSISIADDYDLTLKLADKLYFKIGTDYGDATMRCLRCEFPGRDVTKNFDYEPFRKNFFNSVVAPVQATFNSFKNHRFG